MATQAVNGNSGIVVLGKWLESKYDVVCSEHPAFGGVDPGHASNSYHYRNAAIDVNHDQGNESAVLNEIYDLLSREADAFGIKELFFQSRGIPSPVEKHEDHLHIALVGPPTAALVEYITGLDGKPFGSVTDALGDAASSAADFAGGQATKIAQAIVNLLLDALGDEGARILLYIALVGGGATLIYYGIARSVGMQKPIGTPASLALAVGTKGKAS